MRPQVLHSIFGIPTRRGPDGKRYATDVPAEGQYRLTPQQFPYMLPAGTQQLVFWTGPTVRSFSPGAITARIGQLLDEAHGAGVHGAAGDFVWYENPKMSVHDDRVYHVQAFWRPPNALRGVGACSTRSLAAPGGGDDWARDSQQVGAGEGGAHTCQPPVMAGGGGAYANAGPEHRCSAHDCGFPVAAGESPSPAHAAAREPLVRPSSPSGASAASGDQSSEYNLVELLGGSWTSGAMLPLALNSGLYPAPRPHLLPPAIPAQHSQALHGHGPTLAGANGCGSSLAAAVGYAAGSHSSSETGCPTCGNVGMGDPFAAGLRQLTEMGFDAAEARAALVRAGCNVHSAANILISGQ